MTLDTSRRKRLCFWIHFWTEALQLQLPFLSLFRCEELNQRSKSPETTREKKTMLLHLPTFLLDSSLFSSYLPGLFKFRAQRHNGQWHSCCIGSPEQFISFPHAMSNADSNVQLRPRIMFKSMCVFVCLVGGVACVCVW